MEDSEVVSIHLGRKFAISTIALMFSSGLAAAQPAMGGFLPIDKFVFFLAGEEDPNAEVFQSQAAGAYLVMSALAESPILVQARSAAVMTVNLMKVDRQSNGSLNLLEGSMLAPLGKFSIAGEGITFALDGKPAELRNKPWLLGEQDLAGMQGYSRDYRDGAAAYAFSEPVVRQLLAESRPVEVRVFFGSWCSHCQQVLPRVLRVAEELQGSTVELSFYGLPQGAGFSADPEAQRHLAEAARGAGAEQTRGLHQRHAAVRKCCTRQQIDIGIQAQHEQHDRARQAAHIGPQRPLEPGQAAQRRLQRAAVLQEVGVGVGQHIGRHRQWQQQRPLEDAPTGKLEQRHGHRRPAAQQRDTHADEERQQQRLGGIAAEHGLGLVREHGPGRRVEGQPGAEYAQHR